MNNDAANKIKENVRREKPVVYVKPPRSSGVPKVVGGFFFLCFIGTVVATLQSIGRLISGSGVSDLDIIIMGLVLCGFVSYKMFKKIRFNSRYKKYYSIIREREVILLDDLSDFTGINKDTVAVDLDLASRKKLIPQGHMGRNERLFFTRDSLYSLYLQNPEEYEKNDGQKIREEEEKQERTKRAEDILQTAKKYIFGIRESNALIDSEEVSQKLDRMESLVSQIFDEAYKDPDKVSELGMFMNYYLPTTRKLLAKYAEIEERGFVGESAGSTKLEIEQSLDVINSTFETILNKLYRKESVDISADIKTMEAMMRQEGLL